jgi:molybdate transport system substrate-binding protein
VRRGIAIAATAAVLAAGCGGSSSGGEDGESPASIKVFAASSLTNAFTEAGKTYEEDSGTSSKFSFAGSQDLVAQIGEGAPADVIATADTKTMDQVSDELATQARTLAHNQLVIVTAKGNPHDITTLDDLADPDLIVVLADPSVPAGSYAAQALDAAGVTVKPKSLELDVRSVLTKVQIGEADAGIVYATDAQSAEGKVDAVPIKDAPVATYEIAPVTDDGKAFVDYVLSAEGQDILATYGFLPP